MAYGVPNAATSLRIGPINFSFLLTGCDRPGVYLFFVLSGYLMGKGFRTGRYAPGSPLHFYTRRILRIVPAYVAFLAIVLPYGVLIGTFHAPDIVPLLKSLLSFTYNAQNGLPNDLIGHLWTVSTEMQFYVVTPLAALILTSFCGRLKPKAIIATIIVVLVAGFAERAFGVYHSDGLPRAWAIYMVPNLDIFIVGMLLNYLPASRFGCSFERLRYVAFGLMATMYCLCSLAVFLTLMGRGALGYTTVSDAYGFVVPTLSAGFAALLVYAGECLNQAGAAAQPHRAFVFLSYLGTITYSFYLWHGVFLEKFQMPLANPAHPIFNYLGLFLIVGILTGIVAALSHAFVERPFYHMRAVK